MRFAAKSLILFLLGLILGSVVTTFFAPKIITWYQTTSDPNAMCNCVTTAHNTVQTLVRAQAIGAAVGAVVLLTLGLVVFRRRRREPEPQQKPAAPAGPS